MTNILRGLGWLAASAIGGATATIIGAYLYLEPEVPPAESYRNIRLETPLRMYTSDHKLVAEFGDRRLIPATLAEMPVLFQRALLDTEDKRFYEHSGVDWLSTIKSAWLLLINRGEITRGGSTLTMQLAKNTSFSPKQDFIRKFKEMILALQIENELSKDQILELYLNMMNFGKKAHGAQAAAFTYYGQPLADLNLPQLAMLAGIPQRPTENNPINGPRAALDRRDLVLLRMHQQGTISDAEYADAIAAPITARLHTLAPEVSAPYAAELARQEVVAQFGEEAAYTRGLSVILTLSSKHQHAANRAVLAGIRAYDQRHGYRGAETTVPALLADSPPEDLVATVTTALRDRPTVPELVAAAVLAVGDDNFAAMMPTGETVAVEGPGYAWAAPYITVDRLGTPPRTASEVVAVGDVVRLRRVETPIEVDAAEVGLDEPAPEPAVHWELSQLPDIETALVSMDPNNGAIQAMVGGFDFEQNQYNHATQAKRQPGSGFKPFVYSAALEQGITPAEVFVDAPLVFESEGLEGTYRPDNFGGRFNGPTRVREALYRSINLVSMRVLLKTGTEPVLQHVSRFGFDTTDFPRDLQLAVGGGTIAVSPLAMTRAFSVFANGGYRVEPHLVRAVRLSDTSEVLYAPQYPEVCATCEEEARIAALRARQMFPGEDAIAEAEAAAEPVAVEPGLKTAALENTAPQNDAPQNDTPENDTPQNDTPQNDTPQNDTGTSPADPTEVVEPVEPLIAERVLNARNAYLMNSILGDVIRRGTGVRAYRELGRRDLRGKTGTTNEADTWFNGFNRNLVATVWMGFSDHRPVGRVETGSKAPLPIWIDYMRDVLADVPEETMPQPPGLVQIRIDPVTGLAARLGQPGTIFEYFYEELAPTPPTEEEVVFNPATTTAPTGSNTDASDMVLPQDIF